jgi:Rieske Fe-S protein
VQFPHRPTTRRAVLAGTCGAACAAALTACSTYGASGPAPAPTAPADPTGAPSAGAPSAGGGALARTSEIPVGGGTVFPDQDIVITQPDAGEFRAFSATCTHQGCAVDAVSDGTINCPCHGSRFAVADGSVVDGPAESPLPEREIEVTGEEIVLA